jgi:hypothetical protein
MGSNSKTYFFLNLLSQVYRLGDLMMQLVLIVLTKRKKHSAIANCSGTVVNVLSINVSIILTDLVYLQKMDQTSTSWAFH